jgi:serine/threonine protein kinase
LSCQVYGECGKLAGVADEAGAVPEIPGVEDLILIGRGGFASVYRGYQRKHSRHIAVKIIPLAGVDLASRRRAEREASTTGQLSNNPYVVTLYDSGFTPDQSLYLLMELCPNGSFADVLRRRLAANEGPLPIDEVITLGYKIAGALAEAHARLIVHRDVSPSNILIKTHGEPALADFGLSIRPAEEVSRGLDALNPAHAAPETLESGAATAQSDVYALASCLYTLASGAPPFRPRPGEAPLQHTLRILNAPPPPLPEDLPEPFVDLVSRGLGKDPDRRPTAADFEQELLALAAAQATTLPGQLGPPPSDMDLTQPRGNLPPPPAVSPGESWFREQRRALIRGGIAAVIVVVALVVALVVAPSGAGPKSGGRHPSASLTTRPTSTPVPGPSVSMTLQLLNDDGKVLALSWTPVKNVQQYLLAIREASPTPRSLNPVSRSVPNARLSVLANAEYCIQVDAVPTSGGQTVFSQVLSIRGAHCPAEI